MTLFNRWKPFQKRHWYLNIKWDNTFLAWLPLKRPERYRCLNCAHFFYFLLLANTIKWIRCLSNCEVSRSSYSKVKYNAKKSWPSGYCSTLFVKKKLTGWPWDFQGFELAASRSEFVSVLESSPPESNVYQVIFSPLMPLCLDTFFVPALLSCARF